MAQQQVELDLPVTVQVGLGSCGIAAGANKVYEAFKNRLVKKGIQAKLKKVGCIGVCYQEVLVDVITPSHGKVTYIKVTPEMVERIIDDHIVNDKPVMEWLSQTNAFLEKQKRVALRNCGLIDPESLSDYESVDGYKALKKALNEMSPDEVIKLITESGLKGRGGAGFSTGLKWRFTRQAQGSPKYIICNADEGDPGAFMDRSLLEGDPHSILEGMIIAGYAVGASHGYIYARAEYPIAVQRLDIALKQARSVGILGKNILGTNFNFDIEIKKGAGAFVCGEETALIASIEGQRGMPRLKPPFPAQSGLWGKPTTISNVETFANVSWIVLNGSEALSSIGTQKSKGTKVFALAGKISKGGLVEVPMGLTLREVIFGIGGGIRGNKKFKAVQLGGPSGGCIPEHLLDTPIDYESITATGAIMGSGGMIVMDETTCMVGVAKFFLDFVQKESCGKCTFCRVGTRRMLEILTRITAGEGRPEDLDKLSELALKVKEGSLCGLGQTAPNPVLTTLKYFRDEYIAHIEEKRCPAKSCKALLTYSIDESKCTGCGRCSRVCPTGAISGERRALHVIDPNLCIKCGSCKEACRFEAVDVS